MTPVSISKTRTRTLLNRSAEHFTLYFSTRKLGKRVEVMRWLDDNRVTVAAIDGDGRTPKFRELSRVEFVPQTTNWQAEAAVTARSLAALHFA